MRRKLSLNWQAEETSARAKRSRQIHSGALDGKLISQQSVDQMKNGMGMSDLKLGDKTFYGHGGSMDGFRSLLVYLPEEKLAVAYTSNGVVYPGQNIVRGVVEIYQNKPFEIPTFESVAVSPEILEKYVAVYSSLGSPFQRYDNP